jgi:hypothetical protein
MDYRILGPLEVNDGDRPLVLGDEKQRALVAVLLLHAREVVSADRAVEDRIEANLALGRNEQLVGEPAELVKQNRSLESTRAART